MATAPTFKSSGGGRRAGPSGAGGAERRVSVISQIGFASSKRLAGRLVDKLRKSPVSHAVFIIDDELLGPLVVHAEARRLRVMTLEEFERDHRMAGVVQPKVQLAPALAEVLGDLRGARPFGPCTELVCEVLRRGGYPGAFALRAGISAAELFEFLKKPPLIPRGSVRLFNSSGGGSTPPPRDP